MERLITGIAAAPGLAIGPAVLAKGDQGRQAIRYAPAEERAHFYAALKVIRKELAAGQQSGGVEASLVRNQSIALEDPELLMRIESAITTGETAEEAVKTAAEVVVGLLTSLDDPYLRERAADVRTITGRLLKRLKGEEVLPSPAVPSVLVAHDLYPSQIARLDRERFVALVTTRGGANDHAAVLARGLELPAVAGADGALAVAEGTMLVVDGTAGLLIVDPSPETLTAYRERLAAITAERLRLKQLFEGPATTADGHRIELAANIAVPEDLNSPDRAFADGIGLFRTEFLFTGREQPPSEEEQYHVYCEALAAVAPKPVVIRTVDVGGDKPLPYLGAPMESNPVLGWRGIRCCLDRPHLLRTQLRAILRAAAHGRIRVILPMVTDPAEVQQVRSLLEECQRELEAQSLATGAVAVGVMVEVPAVALCTDMMAPLVDFFSIGTNDLTQYTLAVDRCNSAVGGLYNPLHPAVMRLIDLTVQAAHRHGRWVGLCGELGGDPDALAALVGLGIDQISMSLPHLTTIKSQLHGLTLADCRAEARRLLGYADGEAE